MKKTIKTKRNTITLTVFPSGAGLIEVDKPIESREDSLAFIKLINEE